jgi:hypothetical protein
MERARTDRYFSGERILKALEQAAADAAADPIKRAVAERAIKQGSPVIERAADTVQRPTGAPIIDPFASQKKS